MTHGYLVKMAFRNVFRFKRRTFITFTAISLGLALLIITITLMNGIDLQSISNIINCQTSHLKIFKQGYFDKRDELPTNLTITEPGDLHEWIESIPGVKAVESRILFGVGLIKGMDELPCLGVAIQPEKDPGLFKIKESLVAGQWLEPGEMKMLVGRNLAEDMGITVGDQVTIRVITSTKGEGFSWNAVDVEIKGIFDTGHPAVDSQRIIIPLQQARQALSLEAYNQATEIVVRLNNNDDQLIQDVSKHIRQVLKKQDLEVYTWKDLAGTFLAISEMKTQRSSVVILIILLIASMGIINTMLMAVMERTREIGMMAAMGMKKSEIIWLFLYEGGFIGINGSLLGSILGGLAGWYLEVHGWSIAAMGKSMQQISAAVYPVKNVFYAELSFDVLLMTFLFGVAIALIASLYPASKAAGLNPIQALRHI